MFSAIWAEDLGGSLGDGKTLLWNIPEDFKRFKNLTLHSPIVMGRGTWDSLPETVKPLPERLNIVISRTLRAEQLPDGVAVLPSVKDLDMLHFDNPVVWIIGGGSIYEQLIKRTSLVERTVVHLNTGGQVKAPNLKANGFSLVHESNVIRSINNDIPFHYETWERSTNYETHPVLMSQ